MLNNLLLDAKRLYNQAEEHLISIYVSETSVVHFTILHEESY